MTQIEAKADVVEDSGKSRNEDERRVVVRNAVPVQIGKAKHTAPVTSPEGNEPLPSREKRRSSAGRLLCFTAASTSAAQTEGRRRDDSRLSCSTSMIAVNQASKWKLAADLEHGLSVIARVSSVPRRGAAKTVLEE
eukprot:6212422-Pleurochrysis_carterae.AAC.3